MAPGDRTSTNGDAHLLPSSADGVSIALHDLGGTGRPLLFTHGNGLNAGMWASVAPLLGHRYHCWGLDFPRVTARPIPMTPNCRSSGPGWWPISSRRWRPSETDRPSPSATPSEA